VQSRKTALTLVTRAAFAVLLCLPSRVEAITEGLDLLSLTTLQADNFVTWTGCSSLPSMATSTDCNPAALARRTQGRFGASGFLSVSDTGLSIVEELRDNTITYDRLQRFFSTHNYSETIINTQIEYEARYWRVGARPKRMVATFEIHNPNLPFVSISYRDETHLFASGAYSLEFGKLSIQAGMNTTLLYREEYGAETTLADFAVRSPTEIVRREGRPGFFADIGARLEWDSWAVLSVVLNDLGWFFRGIDQYANRLFLKQDRIPRISYSLGIHPRVWKGQIVLGTALSSFLTVYNRYESQWSGYAGYVLGPGKFLAGFGWGIFRTSIGVDVGSFGASVAQEWINTLETGRSTHPRFSLEARVSL
jgi:hypothetical protein